MSNQGQFDQSAANDAGYAAGAVRKSILHLIWISNQSRHSFDPVSCPMSPLSSIIEAKTLRPEGDADRAGQDVSRDAQDVENVPGDVGRDVENAPSELGQGLKDAASFVGDKIGGVQGDASRAKGDVNNFDNSMDQSYDQGDAQGQQQGGF